MCGIIGAVGPMDVKSILLNGLKRLEYRGYDSAGVATIDAQENLQRVRCTGKIKKLEKALSQNPPKGNLGIAHTRWATHGEPSEKNAHPFISNDQFAIVHNGIIENHLELRQKLTSAGYIFSSDTDSETIAHLIHYHSQQSHSLIDCVRLTVDELTGAYSLGIISTKDPDTLVAVRHGSPLVIGKGLEENFIASDPLALIALTQEFIYLEDNDIAIITSQNIQIENNGQKNINRKTHILSVIEQKTNIGTHKHFMRQEIFYQPHAINNCIKETTPTQILANPPQHIVLIACGTSYFAALTARYWIEEIAKIPCSVEVASEYRYKRTVTSPNTLAIFISQSGETADTLAALKLIQQKDCVKTLAICNVAQSSLIREANYSYLTMAGAEIGVASTKAFTTQLTALLSIALSLGKQATSLLHSLPSLIEETLLLDEPIKVLAQEFSSCQNALFIGRNSLYPIALEGALKLKEISYIHAEGYPAGELKHGPLALVDENMPVIALAPNDNLFAKMSSSLKEVSTRRGKLFVLTDIPTTIKALDENIETIQLAKVDSLLAPIIYTIPLQLLAYHVAVLKGTDVDQPRNLAKSVTVE